MAKKESPKKEKIKKEKQMEEEEYYSEEEDFGGLPDRDLKKGLGCG